MRTKEEIDNAIAIEVMKWRLDMPSEFWADFWFDPLHLYRTVKADDWSPTNNANQAMRVEAKMFSKDWLMRSDRLKSEHVLVTFQRGGEGHTESGLSFPETLCRAALKAVSAK